MPEILIDHLAHFCIFFFYFCQNKEGKKEGNKKESIQAFYNSSYLEFELWFSTAVKVKASWDSPCHVLPAPAASCSCSGFELR